MKKYITLLTALSLFTQACTTTNKNLSKPIDKNKEFEIPAVTKPKVNCSQVPDSIEGTKWIEKHRVCIIDSPSTWSR